MAFLSFLLFIYFSGYKETSLIHTTCKKAEIIMASKNKVLLLSSNGSLTSANKTCLLQVLEMLREKSRAPTGSPVASMEGRVFRGPGKQGSSPELVSALRFCCGRAGPCVKAVVAPSTPARALFRLLLTQPSERGVLRQVISSHSHPPTFFRFVIIILFFLFKKILNAGIINI